MDKKDLAKIESSNDIQNIYHTFAVDIMRNLDQTLKLQKSVKVAVLVEMGVPRDVIEKVLSISRSSLSASLTHVRQKPKLRQKFGQVLAELTTVYKNSCRTQLPLLAKAESKAVLKYMESPELLIERPALAKQIKQAAGVVLGEDQQTTVHVNVGQVMQNILVEARQPVQAIELDVIDAEITEDNKT